MTDSQMRIRPMTAADAPQVADLTTQLGYPTSTEQATERLAALDERPAEHAALVAEEGGRAVGWVHVELVTSLATGFQANIGGLVVDGSRRSDGIGADLLAAAEAWARERGARTMLVRSRVTRERAHRFYEREGYDLVKTSNVFEKPLV
jgi:GNAT superfamily N-acetyltransferase